MSVVTTEKELGEALKRGDDTIEIEGDLANKTIKIRATGTVAWAVAIGAVGIAVYAAIATLGSTESSDSITDGKMAFVAAPAAAAIAVLGLPVTYTAIAIAVVAGGIGALTSLRDYKEISRSQNKLILKKK